MMDQRQRDALDAHITGNYGEDQFRGIADPSGLVVKDLVTLLVTSEGPVETYAVVLDPGDGEPVRTLYGVYLDHERKALILERE